MNLTARLTAIAALAIIIASCGGGSNGDGVGNTYTASSGVAQKGPLQQGSSVTAQELDARLTPTGKQYSYQITSNLGTFAPTSQFTSRYIGLIATGYYFDEVANAISGGPITLNAYGDLSAGSVLNVNLLTTLAYQRIEHLVASGATFSAAVTQAEGEVLAALNIQMGASYGSFGSFDISKSGDGDRILAAASSLFVYGNTSGSLSALIASFQSDIAINGRITEAATLAALASAARALNPAAVAVNLNHEYASAAGIPFAANDISDWIDRDGDGLVGRFKFQVPEATQSTEFSFPSFVTDPHAGETLAASAGQLSVNGAAATGPVTLKAGDIASLSPPPGAFPNGVRTVYLLSGATRIGRVSFVSGLLSIAIKPANSNIPVGLTEGLVAVGTFTDSSTADLTSNVTWVSSSPASAMVNSTSGLVTATAPGMATITATAGSVAGSTSVTAVPATLLSISITPNPAVTGIGIARSLTAQGTYSDGSTRNLTTVASWIAESTSVATVKGGLVTGVSLGSTSVTASYASVSGGAPVNVTANTWAPAASMSTPRLHHTATLLSTGQVLVAGGSSGGSCTCELASAEIYDPTSDAWTTATSLATGRYRHTATLLNNGKVLVAGGTGTDNSSVIRSAMFASAETYDATSNSWSSAAPMATARASHTATLLVTGKVLVTGGWAASSPSASYAAALASAEIYDPSANMWSSAGSMSITRVGHTATILADGRVLVAGGRADGGLSWLASADIYDPATNSWTPAAGMPAARAFHTTTLLMSGHVLVAGDLVFAAIYDPTSNTWSSGGNMPDARDFSTATLLNSGRVLVAGGSVNTTVAALGSAQLYEPSSNVWTSAGSMADPRLGHAATLLPSGATLVTGGTNGTVSALASSETYW